MLADPWAAGAWPDAKFALPLVNLLDTGICKLGNLPLAAGFGELQQHSRPPSQPGAGNDATN
jgi:hypothetical protein